MGALRTPERDAVMREHYTSSTRQAAIVVMLNALPGPEVWLRDLQAWAIRLDIRRPIKGYANVESQMAAFRTPGRDAVMLQYYPTCASSDSILAMLHALPGRAMPPSQLVNYAGALGLRRPPAYFSMISRRPRGPDGLVEPRLHTVETRIEEAPADLDTALRWGRMNRVPLKDDPAADLDAVNRARRSHALPVFAVRLRAA